MRPFKFRPQPALDLRARQLDAAEQALASAQADVQRAEVAVESADVRIREASSRGLTEWQSPEALLRLEWHRNWMVGLERDAAKLRRELDERRA